MCRPEDEPLPLFTLSTRVRLLSISSVAGLSGRLSEDVPDDAGEGPLDDEADRRWTVASRGDLAVWRLAVDNVGECMIAFVL